MLPRCLPPSFGSIWLTIREQIIFEGFQDGHSGDILRYRNNMILANLNLLIAPMPPITWPQSLTPSFDYSDLPFGSRCGGHLRCRNRLILAILNCYVAPMPPTKFQLRLTYALGGDVVWRISRWPSWISERNDFNNSEFTCLPSATH